MRERADRVGLIDTVSPPHDNPIRVTRSDDGALRARMRSLMSVAGSVIGGCMLCWGARVCGEPQAPVPALLRRGAEVRRRGGRKRATATRRPIDVPLAENPRWRLDFVSDLLTDGRRFRILTVVDNWPAKAWLWWRTPRSQVPVSTG